MISVLTCQCWTMVLLYMVAIASYHSGAHLIKPQFPVNLRTTLSQGCHISYNLVTTLPLYTRLLLGCYNLVRLSTGCDNLGISIWDVKLKPDNKHIQLYCSITVFCTDKSDKDGLFS